MLAINGFKICSHCKKNLPISDYHKNRTTKDRLGNECKTCLLQIRKRNLEKKHIYDKEYCLDNAKIKRHKAKKWYYEHHDYALIRNRGYRKSHPEVMRAYYQTEEYKQKHRQMSKIQKAKRREMGFIKLMNNPFPDDVKIDWHHVNDIFVIPIPKRVHNKCSNLNPDIHREKCNFWINYFYGFDVERLLSP